jgi:hypothetical protein
MQNTFSTSPSIPQILTAPALPKSPTSKYPLKFKANSTVILCETKIKIKMIYFQHTIVEWAQVNIPNSKGKNRKIIRRDWFKV